MDGRKNNGGYRPGAGRKPLTEELKVRELVSPYVPGALQTLVDIMENAKRPQDKTTAAKILLSYAWGTPSQHIDHTTDGDKIEHITFEIIRNKDN